MSSTTPETNAAPAGGLIAGYRPPLDSYDELRLAGGGLREPWPRLSAASNGLARPASNSGANRPAGSARKRRDLQRPWGPAGAGTTLGARPAPLGHQPRGMGPPLQGPRPAGRRAQRNSGRPLRSAAAHHARRAASGAGLRPSGLSRPLPWREGAGGRLFASLRGTHRPRARRQLGRGGRSHSRSLGGRLRGREPRHHVADLCRRTFMRFMSSGWPRSLLRFARRCCRSLRGTGTTRASCSCRPALRSTTYFEDGYLGRYLGYALRGGRRPHRAGEPGFLEDAGRPASRRRHSPPCAGRRGGPSGTQGRQPARCSRAGRGRARRHGGRREHAGERVPRSARPHGLPAGSLPRSSRRRFELPSVARGGAEGPTTCITSNRI